MSTQRTNRRSTGRRPRAPRRVTIWENLAFSTVFAIGGNQDIADLTPEPMATSLVGTATLVRMVAQWSITIPVAVISPTPNFHSVGIAVVTADAFTAAALPDPESDFQQSWYYWNRWMVRINAAVTSTVEAHFPVDIRTARRLRSGYKLVMINETPVTNTLSLQLAISMRLLWQVTS